MPDYVCPNGHEFPRAVTVGCEKCSASVVCVPHAEAMRLHGAFERAERDALIAQGKVAQLREALDWIYDEPHNATKVQLWARAALDGRPMPDREHS